MDGIKRLGKNELGEREIRITSDQVISFPVHAHQYCEMTLYEPFEGDVFVNRQRINMNGPELTAILVTQSDIHRISVECASKARYIKIAFDPCALSPSARAQLSGAVFLKGISRTSLPALLFEEALTQRDEPAYCAAMVESSVMYLFRCGERLENTLISRASRLALLAAEYINDHYTEPLTLTDVADNMTVSPQYLSAVFSRETGIGFSEYLTALRLRYAAELLRDAELSITEICFRCGYGNLSHFLRSFKIRFGMTPLHYRRSTMNTSEKT